MYNKSYLFAERGQFCQCGCGQYAHDVHHFAVPNLKRFDSYVNDPRNVVLVNHHEHVDLKKFDNAEWRLKFWRLNVLRYGSAAMDDFRKSAPAKLDKDRFSFLNTEDK